jgi:hypothetical protein
MIDDLLRHINWMLTHIGEITAEAGISDNRVKSLIARQDISGLSDGELEKIWEVVLRKRG